MTKGRILVASNNGIYLLKLSGDIRVTLCASIADYIDKIFSDEKAQEVYVDLMDAECIDSTTLGLLAKLAIHTQQHFGIRTRLLCVNPDILRILDAMDISGLFDIPGMPERPALTPREIVPAEIDEELARKQVLEAHQLLVKLNPGLMTDFFDLINSLESRE